MVNHRDRLDRRAALGFLGQAAVFVGTASSAMANGISDEQPNANAEMEQLKKRLAAAPRRRQFKSVPFVVHQQDQSDHEAAGLVLAYSNRSRQVWECTEIGAPWLNLMREAINGQVFAHGNPGFLAVAAVHGSAHLALFDQAAWDRASCWLQRPRCADLSFVTRNVGDFSRTGVTVADPVSA